MIPALIIWLFKKYIRPALRNKTFPNVKIFGPLRCGCAYGVALLCLAVGALAQEQTVKYNVLHSGKVVGQMNLYRKRNRAMNCTSK
jgi:hypothetical protein